MLDSNLQLTMTKMTNHFDFEIQSRVDLRDIKELKYSIQSLRPYQFIDISERAIVIGDRVFSIGSGSNDTV